MEPQFELIPPSQQRPSVPPPKKSIFKGLGAAGAIVLAILAKFKFLLLFLAKFKFLLFGGLKTILSMGFMIWVYSLMWGWKFAAGFVFLILVHEMGHVVAAKWLGLPVSAPLFIPFIGAAITMKENPRDAWTEALMAYGGPLAGCIGSWICWFIALQFQLDWMLAVAKLSFLINIFNMIPVPPLDGGRICAAVSPWFWIFGLVLLGLAVVYFHAWNSIVIIVLVLFAAIPRFKQAFFGTPTPEMRAYYNTHIANRFTMAFLFLGLLAALVLGYWDASQHLSYIDGQY